MNICLVKIGDSIYSLDLEVKIKYTGVLRYMELKERMTLYHKIIGVKCTII